ncbi:MAG: formate dehydrogenase subunit delta [Acidobacteria bacterium]|nr:formate dehydrogenase subunit delta [Acidobacteriota bacterium]
MRVERLVSMANDIGAFFDAEPDKAEAARSVANHLKRFWDPRMRKEIVAHYESGGEGLDEPARSGVQLLAGAGGP